MYVYIYTYFSEKLKLLNPFLTLLPVAYLAFP